MMVSSSPDRDWAPNLLLECAKYVSSCSSSRDENHPQDSQASSKLQELMGLLNELSSPYGDCEQRMCSGFLQALFCKLTRSGPRCYKMLTAAAQRAYSFDSLRQMILKYQEVSPWTTFGHVASNGAILEALQGESKVHIVDISNTFCTQWPMFLESLATRPEGAPELRITTVVTSCDESSVKVMKEVGNRLHKFARLMGVVPFEFKALHQPNLETLDTSSLGIQPDETLVINCIDSLHHVAEFSSDHPVASPREAMLGSFASMKPKLVTLVEQEVDFTCGDFLTCFQECISFYSIMFQSLEESFPQTSNERLMLERIAGRNLVNILACRPRDKDVVDIDNGSLYRLQRHSQWCEMMLKVGFQPSNFTDDTCDDVRALLKRYKESWAFSNHENFTLFLTWKDKPTVCASAWKP